MNANIARENVLFNFTHTIEGKRILKNISDASANGKVEVNVSPTRDHCKLAFQALSIMGFALQVVPMPSEGRFDIIVGWGVIDPFYGTNDSELGLV